MSTSGRAGTTVLAACCCASSSGCLPVFLKSSISFWMSLKLVPFARPDLLR